jgi:hypothetical protein
MKTINKVTMSNTAVSIRNSWAKEDPKVFSKIAKDEDLSGFINAMAQMFADDSND